MALTTFFMLRTVKPGAAAALVFIAGVAMAPVFPTTLAITQSPSAHDRHCHRFRHHLRMVGLAVSSRLIGAIAGGDPLAPKEGPALDPAFSVLMIVLNLAIWPALR